MKEINVITQKVIAMLIIIVMVLAQYAMTGVTSISYAIDMLATTSDNVEFRAYFEVHNLENEKTEETDTIDSKIDASDVKLKIDVAVKNEGYFNGQISLENAGFKLNGDINSDSIAKIENNMIYLNQINAEETANIEVGIQFLDDVQFNMSALNSPTIVQLTGTYYSSKREIPIIGESKVTVNWTLPEDTKAELETKVLTNSVYKVGEEEKRVVQALVRSKLQNNAYPVQTTQIQATIPEGAEKVTVHKRTTSATNGNKDFTEANYTVDNDMLAITVNNDEQDGKISWLKNSQDIYVVTYEFPKDINLSNESIQIRGRIITYANDYIETDIQKIDLNETKDGIVTVSEISNENEIYKGKIYTGEQRDYTTYTRIYVDYAEAIDGLKIESNEVVFTKMIESKGNATEEKNANMQYKELKFNKDNVSKILGQTWSMTIDGAENPIVTSEMETDENGNITVKLVNGTKKFNIETSAPVNNGTLEFETTIKILETAYTREEISDISGIKGNEEVTYVTTDKSNKTVAGYNIDLKETESKASFELSTEKLSTLKTNENVELTAILNADNETMNLYKNPTVEIVFPKEIKNVNVRTAEALYKNGLKIVENKINKKENGSLALYVKFEGKQQKYDTNGGTELHLFLDIDVDDLTASKKSAITMNYTNENDGTNKSIKKDLEFEVPEIPKESIQQKSSAQLKTSNVVKSSISTGIDAQIKVFRGNTEISENDTVAEGETLRYQITIINNSGKDINNINVKAVQTNGKLWKFVKEEMYNPYYGKSAMYTKYEPTDSNEIEFDKIEILKNGESTTLSYQAIANLLEDNVDKKIFGTIYITSEDGILNSSVKTVENSIKTGEIQVSLLEVETREEDWIVDNNAMVEVAVKNLTANEIKNVETEFTLSKELSTDKDNYIDFRDYKDRISLIKTEKQENGETIVRVKISNVLPNEEITMYVTPYVLESREDVKVKLYAKAKTTSENEYYSNEIERIAKGIKNRDIKIDQKAFVDGKQITKENAAKDGDEIELIINITNNDETKTIISISDSLMLGLELTNATLIKNNNETNQNDKIWSTGISLESDIDGKETITLKLNAKLETAMLAEDKFRSVINVIDKETFRSYNSEIAFEATVDRGITEDDNPENNNPENDDPENNTPESNDPENGNPSDNNNSSDSQEYEISGMAWIDSNKNGKKESAEKILSGVEVKVINSGTGALTEISTITNSDGTYNLKVPKGKYILIFLYDTNTYDITTYKASGISEDSNSNVVSKKVTINGEERIVGATDEINVSENISNINIGLIAKENFDLKLDKYVSKIVVTNKEGTRTKTFKNGQIAKTEIKGKYLSGSEVIIEYTLKVTNVGDTVGYVNSIVDKIPQALKYESSLNSEWSKKGDSLYNTSLSNTKIQPGESKEVKLVLTKTMTTSNTGLTRNVANINKSTSTEGSSDKNVSNDEGTADCIITVSTGEITTFMSVTAIITALIAVGAYIVVKKYIYSKIQ